MTALELLERHEKGHYTTLEVLSYCIWNFHLAEIRTLPIEWQNDVHNALANSPKTDEEWAKAIFICPEGPSQEELRAEARKAVEALRRELEEERDGAENE
jgi:hypothetical protein